MALAILVGLFVSAGSIGTSAVPSKAFSAPYHGVVSPINSKSASGCRTTATIPRVWRFHLSTGVGVGFDTGRAVNACPQTLGGSHPSSQSTATGGFVTTLDLGKPSPNTTQLVAALGGHLNLSSVVSDGGNLSCGKGLYSIIDKGLYEEWNYTKSPGGGYFANWSTNYSVSDNGIWYNSTTSNGVPPSPFILNNTTYRAHDYSTEKFGFCEAAVTSTFDAYALVYDRTTGTYTNSTGTSWPLLGYVDVMLANDTDFGYDRSSTWDGTTGNWTNSSGWYSLNSSGFLTVEYTYPQGTSSSWFNSSLRVPSPANVYYNNTTIGFGGDTVWFNQSFIPSHHYYLKFFFELDQIAWTYDYGYNNNGWANSYAAFTGNAFTRGNGISLVVIQER